MTIAPNADREGTAAEEVRSTNMTCDGSAKHDISENPEQLRRLGERELHVLAHLVNGRHVSRDRISIGTSLRLANEQQIGLRLLEAAGHSYSSSSD